MVWTMGSNFNGKRGLSDPKYHRVSRPSMVCVLLIIIIVLNDNVGEGFKKYNTNIVWI